MYQPRHNRRSIRLKGYDYTQAGAYFVTLVTYHRDEILGEIVNGEMQLSKEGQIAAYHWNLIPAHFPAAELDEWVIMPNHLHGIIVLVRGEASASQLTEHPESWAAGEPHGKGEASADYLMRNPESWTADASPQRRPIGTAAGSLGAILQNFKSVSTRKVNQANDTHGKGEAFANRADEDSESWAANASPQHLWQRNYYEHIIRNEAEWQRIRDYIQLNPLRWQEDQLHSSAALNPFNQV